MPVPQVPPKEDQRWLERFKPTIYHVETANYNDSTLHLQDKLRQQLDQSSFLTVKYGLIDAESALSRISSLPPNWDSYGALPPSPGSIGASKTILERLAQDLILPSTIVASAEGGVSIYFISGQKTAYIESYNEGNQALVMYDQTGAIEVLEIERDVPTSSVGEKILAHLD
jgi:hypothetical protein